MTTKLISANMGMKLVLDVDGQERPIEFSAVAKYGGNTVDEVVISLINFLNRELGADAYLDGEFWQIKFARPAKIKAPKRVSQDEYNRRIKELQP